MPIEIRQLVIKAEVQGGADAGTARGGGAAPAGQSRDAKQQNIIQDVVDQVMQILDDRKAR